MQRDPQRMALFAVQAAARKLAARLERLQGPALELGFAVAADRLGAEIVDRLANPEGGAE